MFDINNSYSPLLRPNFDTNSLSLQSSSDFSYLQPLTPFHLTQQSDPQLPSSLHSISSVESESPASLTAPFSSLGSSPISDKRKNKMKWTAEKVKQLREAVKIHGENWSIVSPIIRGTTSRSCYEKWLQIKKNVKKGLWSNDEDKKLRKAVETWGTNWVSVANEIPQRYPAQCSRRWKIIQKNEVDVCIQESESITRHTTSSNLNDTSFISELAKHSPLTFSSSTDEYSLPKIDQQVKDQLNFPFSPTNFFNQEPTTPLPSSSPFHLTQQSDPQLPSSLHSISSVESESPALLTAPFSSLGSSPISDKRKNKMKWTAEKVKQLREALKIHGEEWKTVSSFVFGTTPKQCFNKWIQIKKDFKKGNWSEDEDRELRKAVEKHGIGNWKKVGNEIPQRYPTQCSQRWATITNSSQTSIKKKNPMLWTAEKVEQLREVVKTYGENWKKVSSLVSGTTEESCSRQWLRINKNIEKGSWSGEEDTELRKAANRHLPLTLFPLADDYSFPEIDQQVEDHQHSLTPFHLTQQSDPQLPSSLHSISSVESESPALLTAPFSSLGSSPISDKRKNKMKWTAEKVKQLREAVKIHGNEWKKVSSLVSGTTPKQCFNKSVQIKKKIKKGLWSNDEDKELRKAVEKHGIGNWKKVGNEISQRYPAQCSQRWATITNSSQTSIKKKNPMLWTAEKVKQLREAVKKYGENWKTVSSLVSGTTEESCSRQWLRINKNIEKGSWSGEEDTELRKAANRHLPLTLFPLADDYSFPEIDQQVEDHQHSLTPFHLTQQSDPQLPSSLHSISSVESESPALLTAPFSSLGSSPISDKRKNKMKWTAEKVKQLKEALKIHGKEWKKVSPIIRGSTPRSCYEKWLQIKKNVKKGHWSNDEDKKLRKAVETWGTNWVSVANEIPQRYPKQCIERWKTIQKNEVVVCDKEPRLASQHLIPPSSSNSPFISELGKHIPLTFPSSTEEYFVPEINQEVEERVNISFSPTGFMNQHPLNPFHLTEQSNSQPPSSLHSFSSAESDAPVSLTASPTSSSPRSSLSSDKGNKKMKWTAEKIEQLREAVKTYGEKNWSVVSSSISGSTPEKCSLKWREIKKKNKKGPWSSQENKELREAVEKYGKQWIKVASQIPERSHTQCRHRWEILNAKKTDVGDKEPRLAGQHLTSPSFTDPLFISELDKQSPLTFSSSSHQSNIPFSPNYFFNQEPTTPLPSSSPFPENLSKRKVILFENHQEIESSSKRQKTLALLTDKNIKKGNWSKEENAGRFN